MTYGYTLWQKKTTTSGLWFTDFLSTTPSTKKEGVVPPFFTTALTPDGWPLIRL